MGWSDEALMKNLRQGDMQAFDELYARHRQPLFNFIFRLLQDVALAEDVFQETYMRVLENADRFNPRRKFSTWLYTVAHNLCMDELRRQSTSIPAEQMAAPPPARDPHDHLLKREDQATAHQLLAALQPHLRTVVVLRVLHDYSQEETAKIVGVPVGTVKSRLHHALKQLRQMALNP